MAVVSRTVAACLLAAATCLPARAEDPATADTADWSGYHFGFALGTPRGDNTWRQSTDGQELAPGDWKGSAMVLSFGRDWQSDQMTYGAQISYGEGSYTAVPTDFAFISCPSCRTTASDLLRLTGRVGFATGQTHLFASGGFARANVLATRLSGLLVDANTTMTGWTLGFGVEQRIGENLSLAVSYDHVDFGTLPLPTYVPPNGETIVELDVLQVGMNVRW
jgi:outer membrane immunogenic protein